MREEGVSGVMLHPFFHDSYLLAHLLMPAPASTHFLQEAREEECMSLFRDSYSLVHL